MEAEERNWGAEEWRAPALEDGDTLMFSECGRIIQSHTYGHDRNSIDYRSHYFRIVKARFGGCYLLVKHGGGQERFQLDHSAEHVGQFFRTLDSSQRYLLMHLFYNVASHESRMARDKTAATYHQAFAEGRLKKRKVRDTDRVKVWIETRRVNEDQSKTN